MGPASSSNGSFRLRRLGNVLTETRVESLLDGLDIDGALDERDVPVFEDEWAACYERLKAREAELDEPARAELLALRETAFLLVFRCGDHDELSGCVSDDFELIGLAVALGIDDPFAAYLLAEFRAGRFAVVPPAAPPAPLTAQLGLSD